MVLCRKWPVWKVDFWCLKVESVISIAFMIWFTSEDVHSYLISVHIYRKVGTFSYWGFFFSFHITPHLKKQMPILIQWCDDCFQRESLGIKRTFHPLQMQVRLKIHLSWAKVNKFLWFFLRVLRYSSRTKTYLCNMEVSLQHGFSMNSLHLDFFWSWRQCVNIFIFLVLWLSWSYPCLRAICEEGGGGSWVF